MVLKQLDAHMQKIINLHFQFEQIPHQRYTDGKKMLNIFNGPNVCAIPHHLSTPPPPHSYIETLIPRMIVFGDGPLEDN